MKRYFEELKRMGYFRSFRPFSMILFGDLISKFTGASMDLNLNDGVSISLRKGWEIKLGDKVEVIGNFNERDFVNISKGCGIAIGMIDEKISEEVSKYPLSPVYAWSAYQESKRFGFLWLKNLIKPEFKEYVIVDGVEGKPNLDFPGEFKLGANFFYSYKDGFINKNKEYLKNVLKAISFFFSHRKYFFYGELVGDVEEIAKFRARCLREAKRGNFVAQRAITNLLRNKIRVTDFRVLNDKFKTKLRIAVPGEKFTYLDLQ